MLERAEFCRHLKAGSAARLSTEALLDLVQRATISYFWEGAHPVSGLAYDRRLTYGEPQNDLTLTGGSGFSVLAIITGVSRGWIDRDQAVRQLSKMVAFVEKLPRFHGAFSHLVNGATGDAVPFSRYDDGGDLIETSFLLQGLICARQYFNGDDDRESGLREVIQRIVNGVEWNWYTRNHSKTLYWHWSPDNHWAMNLPITGWNEGLIAYVLAAGAGRHAIAPEVFHRGWARDGTIRNGARYFGHKLPLGPAYGGPLYFAHMSFCGLDPRRMTDRYCDYWEQNVAHAAIHHAYCVENPGRHKGYGDDCWGLSASHGPTRYLVSTPDDDAGIIALSAALSSFPYLPEAAEHALRHYLTVSGGRLWGRHGFVDAFAPDGHWNSRTYLAINQGPIVAMIENHRSGLLWNLFMSAPEVIRGLERLDIKVANGDRV